MKRNVSLSLSLIHDSSHTHLIFCSQFRFYQIFVFKFRNIHFGRQRINVEIVNKKIDAMCDRDTLHLFPFFLSHSKSSVLQYQFTPLTIAEFTFPHRYRSNGGTSSSIFATRLLPSVNTATICPKHIFYKYNLSILSHLGAILQPLQYIFNDVLFARVLDMSI